jgi:phytoene/squalene synthetase
MTQLLKEYIRKIDFEQIDKHPNILVAARIWDDQRYNAARVCYKFMRMIDDHIDNRKAQEEAISCLERKMMTDQLNDWIECLYQPAHDDPFLSDLVDTVSRFHIPLELFHNFTKSMLYDINNEGFTSVEQFLDYAEGASVAPASVFVHLCCLQESGELYSPAEYNVIDVARPCALFSYIVHIIRDFQQDQLENLNYFALDVLHKHGLQPADLKAIAKGATVPSAFRDVISEYHQLARHFEEETLQMLDMLSSRLNGRYLFSLHLIYQLYKMVFDRIDIEHGNFTTGELNPTPSELREKVMNVASAWSYPENP